MTPYLVFGLLLVSIARLIFRYRQANAVAADPEVVDEPVLNDYFEARSSALACLPAHLGLESVAENVVYAFVQESHVGEQRELLVANLIGEAELFEFPDFVAAAGPSLALQASAVDLVKAASACLDLAERSRDQSPPLPAHVKLFLVTEQGAWVVQYPTLGPSALREALLHLYDLATALKLGLRNAEKLG